LKPLSHPAIQQKYTTDGNKIIGNNVTKLDWFLAVFIVNF
jgi:hypothetical protein